MKLTCLYQKECIHIQYFVDLNIKILAMKMKFLFFLVLFAGSKLFAQINLVGSTGTYYNVQDSRRVIKLERAGYKFYMLDYQNRIFFLYNLNLSLYKQITIPVSVGNFYYVGYITETLFDNDSTDIDYMVSSAPSSTINNTTIFNENGSVLFYEPLFSFGNIGGTFSSETENPCVFATDSGTFMALDSAHTTRKFYKLPGTLECAKCYGYGGSPSVLTSLPSKGNENDLFKLYPNPSNNYITIEFIDLKEKGNIFIIDNLGNVVQKYPVSSHQKEIIIPVENYSPGLYLYILAAGDKNLKSGKFAVVK
jgi:hypothetical protein